MVSYINEFPFYSYMVENNLLDGTSHNDMSSSMGAGSPAIILLMSTKEPSISLSKVFIMSSRAFCTKKTEIKTYVSWTSMFGVEPRKNAR